MREGGKKREKSRKRTVEVSGCTIIMIVSFLLIDQVFSSNASTLYSTAISFLLDIFGLI